MCSRSRSDICAGVNFPLTSQPGLYSLQARQWPRTFILCSRAKATTRSPGPKLKVARSGLIAPHFIAFSGSTMLNSRASVAAYSGSEKSPGSTAVPTSTPILSACSRSVWAKQSAPAPCRRKAQATAEQRTLFINITGTLSVRPPLRRHAAPEALRRAEVAGAHAAGAHHQLLDDQPRINGPELEHVGAGLIEHVL